MFEFLNKIMGQPTESVDLSKIVSEGAFLVDVRSPGEFQSGSVKGAVNIPLETIQNQLTKFQGKKSIVVFCRSGNRSGRAESILKSKGIENVYNGGTWNHVSQLVK